MPAIFGSRRAALLGSVANVVVALPPGASATTSVIAPTVHYHIPSATIGVQGGGASIMGRLTTTTPTSILDVDSVISGAVAVGQYLRIANAGGFGYSQGVRIIKQNSASQFLISDDGTTLSSSTAMTTTGAETVVSVPDIMGVAPLTVPTGVIPTGGTYTNQGPRLIVDDYGRQALMFHFMIRSGTTARAQVLQSVAAALSIDTHNFSYLMIGRFLHMRGGTILSAGNDQGTGNFASSGILSGLGISPTAAPFPTFLGTKPINDDTVLTNKARYLCGTNMTLIGQSTVSTADGKGNTTGSCAVRQYIDNQPVYVGPTAVSGRVNRTGMEIGRTSNSTPTSLQFVLYELKIWANEELAGGVLTPRTTTSANTAANIEIERQRMLANWTDVVNKDANVVVIADSRGDRDFLDVVSPASLLTAPNSATQLPSKSVRVIQAGIGGSTFRNHYNWANYLGSPLAPANMFGGGRDMVVIGPMGTNDTNSTWQTAHDNTTTARGDEIYNGGSGGPTSLDVTLTATTNSGFTLSYTGASASFSQTASIWDASTGLATGWGTGSSGAAGSGSFTLEGKASTLIPTDLNGKSLVIREGLATRFTEQMLSRGFKVAYISEIWNYNSTFTVSQTQLRSRVKGDLLTDMTAVNSGYASNLTVKDFADITVGGLAVMGANANALNYVDPLHPSNAGRQIMVMGGDTPANGIRANVIAALGL